VRPAGPSAARRGESACKPGSVPSRTGWRQSFIWGGRRRPPRATYPEARADRAPPPTQRPAACPPIRSCSRRGFPCHRPSPARCALTAPFHPCRRTPRGALGRCVFCGTFRRLTPPRRYLAPCPPEPGLSSTDPPREGCPAATARPTLLPRSVGCGRSDCKVLTAPGVDRPRCWPPRRKRWGELPRWAVVTQTSSPLSPPTSRGFARWSACR